MGSTFFLAAKAISTAFWSAEALMKGEQEEGDKEANGGEFYDIEDGFI